MENNMAKLAEKQDKRADAAIGLKTAVSILDKWNTSTQVVQDVLRISRATYFKAKKGDLLEITLDDDQLDRISMIMNIHAALRIVFDNPENVYGFMSMANENVFFNGSTPLECIKSGSFMALYETFKRIDALRSAQW